MSDVPPAYTSSHGTQISDADVPPPTYTIPTSFPIGASRTSEPLVKVHQVKGHLALLHAFAELKKEVEGALVPDGSVAPKKNDKRWAWFVGVAVERFDIWCRTLRQYDLAKETEEVMPPLDVIMVWHAYMLNPRWYAEDCVRRVPCKLLKEFEIHFEKCLQTRFREILLVAPSLERLAFWASRTGQPFEYSVNGVGALNTRSLMCFFCKAPIEARLMKSEGNGYLQQLDWSAPCPEGCSVKTTKQSLLRVRKLAADLTTPPNEPLAGTLFTANESADRESSSKIKRAIVKDFVEEHQDITIGTPEYHEAAIKDVLVGVKYSIEELKSCMAVGAPSRLLSQIFSAYGTDKIYSVELVGAVLRQGSFVKKMHDLGWTKPEFFDNLNDELVLQHASARYHAFLDLMASSPSTLVVPTLDIDLVWHTHQLLPSKYEKDCQKYLKRFINHDDKVEGVLLNSSYDTTCRVWKERFHIQYSHCGCPVSDGESNESIGKKLSKFVGIYGSKSKSTSSALQPPSHLQPVDRADSLGASHPSEHNAVYFTRSSDLQHKMMRIRYETTQSIKKEQARMQALKAGASKKEKEKEKSKGSSSKSAVMQTLELKHQPHLYDVVSSEDSKGKKEREREREQSGSLLAGYVGAPFLVPVPLEFGGREGVGQCVAENGQLVGPGSCGSGCTSGQAGAGDVPRSMATTDQRFYGVASSGCGGGAGCGGGG